MTQFVCVHHIKTMSYTIQLIIKVMFVCLNLEVHPTLGEKVIPTTVFLHLCIGPTVVPIQKLTESRRDQEEVSWTLTKKLAQKRSRAGRWCWASERIGLLLLQLFPSGGATDIVSVTVLHSSWESKWSLRNAI